MDDVGRLRGELERLHLVLEDLQRERRRLESELDAARSVQEVPRAIISRPDLQQTLSRLIKKVAMIVQAEKCVIMLFDPEHGELRVLPPALGLSADQADNFRVKATEGITGEVFRTGQPLVYNDAVRDPRTIKDYIAYLDVKNGITVALVTKRRDEDERVVEERCIGVMHVFNKRLGGEFNEDDRRLLQMLSEQAAAVIANAQLYIKMAEEKQQLEDTLQSIQSGVLVVHSNGKVALINAAARQIFDVQSEDGTNQTVQDLIDHEDAVKLVMQSLDEDRELARELAVSAVGDRVYQAQTSLMKGDNGETQNVVAIFNDITEIRNIERMKTAFVSTVSHELRTPLASIKGFISTLLADEDETYDTDTRREFYTIVDQECDRLNRLVQDLLNIARIEEGRGLELHWGTVDLPDLCEKVLAGRKAYETKHRFVTEFPGEFPKIVADVDRVHQIVENLVSNAVKYSPDGGTVTVQGALEDEPTVRIDVTDEGVGIPEDKRAEIFERFNRGDEEGQGQVVAGTGIGLYLVKHLAQGHGGDVWLAGSTIGKGSTFSVRLPIVPPDDLMERQPLTSGSATRP
ncbi:MAG: ATP-binding protein [Armatimonadota bacterium]